MFKKKLRIGINAQLTADSGTGGIIAVLRALARLTELDGPEEYVFVGPHSDPEWLRPLVQANHKIVRGPKLPTPSPVAATVKTNQRSLQPLRPLARGLRRLMGFNVAGASDSATATAVESIPPSSKQRFFDALGCDVIHFPFQAYEACSVPIIFNPHDLQHLHYKEFFSEEEIAWREALYPAACRAADTVVVASKYIKGDIVEHLGIPPEKIQVIPWAPPPLSRSPNENDQTDSKAIRKKYGLNDGPFALYPAMTWEHKNHLRLLEAIAQLRDTENLKVQFACTGFKTEFWLRIESRLHELGLNELVKFPGLIPIEDLNALYRASQFVFVPTLYEAASAPVFEAWQHGAPVACSNVTSLPEQAGEAALLFDASSVNEIAAALSTMATDAVLRDQLRLRGTLRLEEFSWGRTARSYRAVYRRAAGQELNEEDRWLLSLNNDSAAALREVAR